MRELGLKQGTIITENDKRTQTEDGQTLEIVPAWEWMLTLRFPEK
jgi:predicted AAA+ superfamily ATPase